MPRVPEGFTQHQFIPVSSDKLSEEYLTNVEREHTSSKPESPQKPRKATPIVTPYFEAKEPVARPPRVSHTGIATDVVVTRPTKTAFHKPTCSWCNAWLRTGERSAGIHTHCAKVKERTLEKKTQ